MTSSSGQQVMTGVCGEQPQSESMTSWEPGLEQLAEFVSLSDLEINPSPGLFPSSSSSFTLPVIQPKTVITNDNAQAPSNQDFSNQSADTSRAGRSKQPVILESLWNEPLVSLNEVEPTKEERKDRKQRPTDIATLVSGPRCETCDEPLTFEQLMTVGTCYLCGF
ncbi:hypothetical protein F5Y16DRAFT_384094 [Xylariaceae sp. FL0255]|nr:hypothetical protein F5Y16DRAFT_384094 [Xylariaceae sp. FL0255]